MSRLRRPDVFKPLRRAGTSQYHARWRKQPLARNRVLYQSCDGREATGSPLALFRGLLQDDRFTGLTHVWLLEDPASVSELTRYAGHPRVQVIRSGSMQALRHLATAGHLVTDTAFGPEFGKRPGQRYLNTWQGTPLVATGYDSPMGAARYRNILRNFLAADHLLSSGEFMTQRIYGEAFRLRNAYRGRILETGLPRVDLTLAPGASAAAARSLQAQGVDVTARRVLAYVPSACQSPEEIRDVAEVLRVARATLPPQWLVLLCPDPYSGPVPHDPALAGHLLPFSFDVNELLALAQGLITDHSTFALDALALGRPVILHESQQRLRPYDRVLGALPASRTRGAQELAGALGALAGGTSMPGPPVVLPGINELDDGAATARVIDTVFTPLLGRQTSATETAGTAVRSVDISSDGRSRVLFHAGALRPNGITSSAINLLSGIDHTRFDVTVFYPYSERPDVQANIAALPAEVRQLPRVGGMNGSKWLHARRHLQQRSPIAPDVADPSGMAVSELYAHEWSRCFGDAEFDQVVDFSGYGPLWDFILLQGPARVRSIFLHNDMVADANRELHGRKHLLRQMGSVFSTYRFFDNLVSVSEQLMAVNRASLAQFAPQSAFRFAHNMIDYDRVRRLAQEPIDPDLRPQSPDLTTFLSMGRLTAEKNHARLINAFALVHQEHPRTRLLILGDGPLAEDLRALVDRLELSGSVVLAGFRANPYPALAACDCFVLPSDHEGQPMVLLEALTLGVPCVLTDFSSSAGALPRGTGLIVKRSTQGVADGMRAFLAGTVPNPAFDPQAYNRTALAEFYAAIN